MTNYRWAWCAGQKTLVWRFGQTRTDGGKEKQTSLEYVSLDSLAQIVPNRPKAVHMLQCRCSSRCCGRVVGPSRAVSLAARSSPGRVLRYLRVSHLYSNSHHRRSSVYYHYYIISSLISYFLLTSLTLTINTQIRSSFLNPASFDRCAWYGSHRCCLPPMISIYYLSDFMPLGRHPYSCSPNARCHSRGLCHLLVRHTVSICLGFLSEYAHLFFLVFDQCSCLRTLASLCHL